MGKLFSLWIFIYFTIPLIILTPDIINNPFGNFVLTIGFLFLPFILVYFFIDKDFKKVSHLLSVVTNHKIIAAITKYVILAIILSIPFLAFFPSYQIQNWIYWHPQHRQGNYDQLTHYLQTKNWKYAAQETQLLMLKITNREQKKWLTTRAIETFPCDALQNIDKLWLNASENKFGFSIQTQIWQQENDGRIDFDYDIEQRFKQKVGWNKEEIKNTGSNFQLSLDTPIGHFPKPVGTSFGKTCIGSLDRLWFGQAVGCYHKIFIRIDNCQQSVIIKHN
jgi:GUN4-like